MKTDIMTSTGPATRTRPRAFATAADSWRLTTPLTRYASAVATGHESVLIPNDAVRVGVDARPATIAFSAVDATRGNHTGMKQGRPPRGIPR